MRDCTDWFSHLTGFSERSHVDVRQYLSLDGSKLTSYEINHDSYECGRLVLPSLNTLRKRIAGPPTGGNLSVSELAGDVLAMASGVVVAFIVGVVAGSRIAWLRRLFIPRKQILEEVSARAREVFFDKRIHHTSGATGMLIYVSLFERTDVVLGDREVLEKLGQSSLDRLCRQLTEGLQQGDLANAICSVIAEAGKQLSGPLPRAENDVNELHDPLVLID